MHNIPPKRWQSPPVEQVARQVEMREKNQTMGRMNIQKRSTKDKWNINTMVTMMQLTAVTPTAAFGSHVSMKSIRRRLHSIHSDL